MDWKTKATIQRAFSAVPGGHRLNYLMQRYVTHSLPRTADDLEGVVTTAERHLDAIRKATTVPIGEMRFFEFGAGYDLSEPLSFAALGVTDRVCFDISPVARDDMIRAAVNVLRGLEQKLPPPPATGSMTAYLASIGLEYVAPGDARQTGFPAHSVDASTTTSVLEHIPPEDLEAILLELRRILKPGGVCSFAIDYHDHFARTDPNIHGLHFLRFSHREWRRWNSSIQYQNRLRHDDYVAMFEKAGFDITAVDAIVDPRFPADPETVPPFTGRTDLAISDGWFTLVNPG